LLKKLNNYGGGRKEGREGMRRKGRGGDGPGPPNIFGPEPSLDASTAA